jgi:UDP-N-acetylmuramyl pentapeptide phosphotransferase/UDP-N-acetylglucosamine-1-phosphate transferase
MTAELVIRLIWCAGAIHLGIVLANIPLPGRLRVRQHLKDVPLFLRQIFYVHWFYIVLVLCLFGALCFGFTGDLAGASPLGRFLSAFMAGFWLLRILLQCFYYDAEVRRANRVLDAMYVVSLAILVGIFGFVSVHPVK